MDLYDTFTILNREEKHHFVPFKILNVLFWQAQHEYDNYTTAPLTSRTSRFCIAVFQQKICSISTNQLSKNLQHKYKVY